jgi:steroid delta-isomerase
VQREDIDAYASEWIAAWNRLDVEAVLEHFADDAVFTSPVAASITGQATLRGKEALRAYWRAAVERAERRQFVLDETIWDADTRQLTIVYERVFGDRTERACEILTFGRSGEVVRGEAMYGARTQEE